MDGEEIHCVLPRKKKYICIIRSSWWSRNLIIKNRDLICNETVAGIQISFKDRNNKDLEFLLLCIHDPSDG